MRTRLLALLVGPAEAVAHLCTDTAATTAFARAGYACATLDITAQITLPDRCSLPELARLAKTVLDAEVPSGHRQFVEERYWYVVALTDGTPPPFRDVELRSTLDIAFAVTWDGALVRGDDAAQELGLAVLCRALTHWYAIGCLGELARAASVSDDSAARVRIRNDLERATLLLDPRVDVYWEVEHDLLDEIRRAWRTTEMEALTNRVVTSLEYLISNRRSRRLETTVLLLTMINSVGVITTLIDFAVSSSSSTPHNIVRLSVGALLTLGSLVAWAALREHGTDEP